VGKNAFILAIAAIDAGCEATEAADAEADAEGVDESRVATEVDLAEEDGEDTATAEGFDADTAVGVRSSPLNGDDEKSRMEAGEEMGEPDDADAAAAAAEAEEESGVAEGDAMKDEYNEGGVASTEAFASAGCRGESFRSNGRARAPSSSSSSPSP
jgi:hypothetical protein